MAFRRVISLIGAMILLLANGVAAYAAEPLSSMYYPYDDNALPLGVPVILVGSASAQAGVITSVEVSLDGGTSWTQAETDPGRPGTEVAWSYVFTPTEPGPLEIQYRSWYHDQDEAPNVRNVWVGERDTPPVLSPVGHPFWFPALAGRHRVDSEDPQPVEVGLRFRVDRDGYVYEIQAYNNDNCAKCYARLWTGDGELVGEALLTSSGSPNSFRFPQRVPVEAGRVYVASYYTPAGHYFTAENYFTGSMVSMPFTSVYDEQGGAGVYRYGEDGGFPDQIWHNSNYWVEPVFVEN